MYRPVRTVVWEGRSGEAPPYPDLWPAAGMLIPSGFGGLRTRSLDAKIPSASGGASGRGALGCVAFELGAALSCGAPACAPLQERPPLKTKEISAE